MGTRGAIGFFKGKKGKITYNHFDSYPEGVGVKILDEIRGFSVKEMKKAFNHITLITNEDKKPTKKEIEGLKKWSDPSVGGSSDNQEVKTYYQLLRNVQGTLKPYLTGEVNLMIDNEKFLKDSLFCEWAYIINLDKEVLEVWEGFQKKPQENRYKETEKELKKESDWWAKERPTANWKKDYYNCALVKEYPLKDLPTKKQFLKDLERKDTED
jgi:hypothetical protein